VKLEARLLAILGRQTDIPVPKIYGIVDDHETIQAPFMLLEAMPGQTRQRTELPSLSDSSLRNIARDTGRHLAHLHQLDAVDSFGFLTADDPILQGESPDGGTDSITVVDPISDWRDRLRDWGIETMTSLEGTRFADVPSDAERVLKHKIENVEGEFEPVLARIDNALENILLENGRLRTMLDWEFTIAATPGYDLSSVTWSLAGGPYLVTLDAPRRTLIREALLDGYRTADGPGSIVQFEANRDCYELLTVLRSMTLLDDWLEEFHLEISAERAAAALRTEVSALLDDTGPPG
jgi:aminoglycoside phosphotransferase (APT) family kinase protein